ncbi:MAG: hypothetical protein HYV36_03695 [Lentisphaerae bacterium]|nr:hypothetical protein [Lentisphaerota bacterium]
MRTILRQAWTLASNTMRDIVRQPVILLLTAACLILTGLLPSAAVFAFGEEVRLVRDGALAFHLVFGLLIAGAAASATIYTEIKRGTVATVLCKPVGRSLYFLATYAGILIVILLFGATALLASLLSVRMVLPGMQVDERIGAIFLAAILLAFGYAAAANFLFRRSFVSQAWLALLPCIAMAFLAAAWLAPHGQMVHFGMGTHTHAHEAALATGGQMVRFGSLMAWQIVPASLLVTLALTVLAAFALSFSTRWPPVLSISASGIVFFLGLISDYLFGAATAWWARLCYRLIPNWQDFWLVDALAGGGNIPWGYVAVAALYAALYAGAVLTLGLLSFREVEIL